jgi:putative transposase
MKKGLTMNDSKRKIFTSAEKAKVALAAVKGITISMDGRGRALDNIFIERLWRTVKYEDVYLKGYETLLTLLLGLTDYFLFYNGERRHQSLGYATPDVVYYHTATGGGAKIVGRFNSARESIVPAEELGQHHTLRFKRVLS